VQPADHDGDSALAEVIGDPVGDVDLGGQRRDGDEVERLAVERGRVELGMSR